MMRRASLFLPLLLVACGGDQKAPSPGATTTTPPKAAQAAAIAKDLRANPDDADAILAKHGMTRQQFEDLMYEIAADPAMSEAYTAKVGM